MVKNGCGQSGHGNLKLTVSDFLHAGTNSGKLKADSVIFGWALSKITMAF